MRKHAASIVSRGSRSATISRAHGHPVPIIAVVLMLGTLPGAATGRPSWSAGWSGSRWWARSCWWWPAARARANERLSGSRPSDAVSDHDASARVGRRSQLRAVDGVRTTRRRRRRDRSWRRLVTAAFVHRTSCSGDPQLHTHVLSQTSCGPKTNAGQRSTVGSSTRTPARRGSSTRRRCERSSRARSASSGRRSARARRRSAVCRTVSSGPSRGGGRRSRPRWSSTAHAASTPPKSRRWTRGGRRTGRCCPRRSAPEWRLRAAKLGLGEARIGRLLGRETLAPTAWEAAFQELAAPSGLTQNESTFGRREVLQALCQRAGQSAAVQELERAADAFLSSPAVVRVGQWPASRASLLDHRAGETNSARSRPRWRCAAPAVVLPWPTRWRPRWRLGRTCPVSNGDGPAAHGGR